MAAKIEVWIIPADEEGEFLIQDRIEEGDHFVIHTPDSFNPDMVKPKGGFTRDELREWAQHLADNHYVIEPKPTY